MLFPIGDDQIQGGFKPIFSYSFIALNVAVFLFQMSLEGQAHDGFIMNYGAIPAVIMGGESYHSIFSSMFMHGGWMHLLGNMMFLWVFADNIEAVIGNSKFLIFYILGGVAATMTHIMMDPSSTIPTVGASGAIAAVLGAYIVMFPGSKVKLFFIYFLVRWPALVFLGLWIGQQLLSGFGSLGTNAGNAGGGVAWWAHIGGFAFGVLVGFYFRQQFKTPERYASGTFQLPGRKKY